jgi:hypothetical protein
MKYLQEWLEEGLLCLVCLCRTISRDDGVRFASDQITRDTRDGKGFRKRATLIAQGLPFHESKFVFCGETLDGGKHSRLGVPGTTGNCPGREYPLEMFVVILENKRGARKREGAPTTALHSPRQYMQTLGPPFRSNDNDCVYSLPKTGRRG